MSVGAVVPVLDDIEHLSLSLESYHADVEQILLVCKDQDTANDLPLLLNGKHPELKNKVKSLYFPWDESTYNIPWNEGVERLKYQGIEHALLIKPHEVLGPGLFKLLLQTVRSADSAGLFVKYLWRKDLKAEVVQDSADPRLMMINTSKIFFVADREPKVLVNGFMTTYQGIPVISDSYGHVYDLSYFRFPNYFKGDKSKQTGWLYSKWTNATLDTKNLGSNQFEKFQSLKPVAQQKMPQCLISYFENSAQASKWMPTKG